MRHAAWLITSKRSMPAFPMPVINPSRISGTLSSWVPGGPVSTYPPVLPPPWSKKVNP